MEITHELLEKFADILVRNIKSEFSIKHLSGNLVNTLQVVNEKDNIKVIIPAQTYNMLLFQTKRVVVHTNHGSYASKLNDEGSSFYIYPNGTRKGSYKIHPGNHKDYLDRVIAQSVQEWVAQLGKYQISRMTELGG